LQDIEGKQQSPDRIISSNHAADPPHLIGVMALEITILGQMGKNIILFLV
jgi:hypothetical protein